MKKLILGLVIYVLTSQANAYTLDLYSVESQNWEEYDGAGGGYSIALLGGNSGADWNFDGSTITATDSYIADWYTGPSVLYTQTIDNLSITLGGSASASSFQCIEGNFGTYVGESYCGGYTFGANYIDESSMTYNIGGDASNQSRSIGGDDVTIGSARALTDFDSTTADDNVQYAGMANSAGQLAMSTWSWVDHEHFLTLTIHLMTGNTTTTMTFGCLSDGGLCDVDIARAESTPDVPVPAAAYLFGSALIGLIGLKRKK